MPKHKSEHNPTNPDADAAADYSRDATEPSGREPYAPARGYPTDKEAQESGKRLVQFFLSYARKDSQKTSGLLDLLESELGALGKYKIEIWNDGKIEVGKDWAEEIERAINLCHFGLLMISPSFLCSDAIQELELPHFVGPQAKRPIIPVGLKTVSSPQQDLRGLEHAQIFLHRPDKYPHGKFWSEYSDAKRKEAFTHSLAMEIARRLDSHIGNDKEVPGVQRQAIRAYERGAIEVTAKGSLLEISERWAKDLAGEIDPDEFIPSSGWESRIDRATRSARDGDHVVSNEGIDAIAFLSDWATSSESPPFCAVLGEYGIGKTTTLKHLTRHLLEGRSAGRDFPLPIFIDLRLYSEAGGDRAVPTLEELLTEVLRQSWQSEARERLDARKIVNLVRNEGALMIFDGLDEKLVHLTPSEGQKFVRQLWSVLPPNIQKSKPEDTPKGKLLLSCRTHYFRDVWQQSAFFTGEDREGISAKNDYRAFVMLPFTEEQILDYLGRALVPGETDNESLANERRKRAEEALSLIASIHNLRELAERPYLLGLIAGELDHLRELTEAGNVVNAATLYDLVVRRWMGRDDGKHIFNPEHKRWLMERLAAAMWASGERSWNVANLEKWLDEELLRDPILAHAYRNVGSDLQKEDLRTATFVLRPDGERDRFRFAHTSLQEFFLASHLFRALTERENEVCVVAWDIPPVSEETLAFLGQLLASEGEEKHRRALGTILSSELPRAVRLAFEYWLAAIDGDWLEPFVPEGSRVNLAGQDLCGFRISGRSRENLLDLRNSCLSSTSLRWAELSYVDLSGADLRKMIVSQSLFQYVKADGCDASGAQLDALMWQEGSARNLCLNDASLSGAEFRSLDIEGAVLPRDWERTAALSRCSNFDELETLSSPIPDSSAEIVLRLGHSSDILDFAISDDLSTAVSVGKDRTAIVWDLQSAQCLRRFSFEDSGLFACSITPNGHRIVLGGSFGRIFAWDVHSGENLCSTTVHGGPITCCELSSDGDRIVVGTQIGELYVWDIPLQKTIRKFNVWRGRISACAINLNGSIVACGGTDGIVRVWNVQGGKGLHGTQRARGSITSCSLDETGSRVAASTTSGLVRVWTISKWQINETYRPGLNEPRCFARAFDTHKVYSISTSGNIELHDSKSSLRLRSLPTSFGRTDFRISTNGAMAISNSKGSRELKVWEVESGECVRHLVSWQPSIVGCGISPHGNYVASVSSDGILRLWEAARGECIECREIWNPDVQYCAVSQNGTRVVTSGIDSGLVVWDRGNNSVLVLNDARKLNSTCGISLDGKFAGSISFDGYVQVFDLATSKAVSEFRTQVSEPHTYYLSFVSTKVVIFNKSDMVRAWDFRTGLPSNLNKEELQYLRKPDESIGCNHNVTRLLEGNFKLYDKTADSIRWTGIHLPDQQWASIDYMNNRVLAHSPGAWRWLGWRCVDPETGRVRILPWSEEDQD